MTTPDNKLVGRCLRSGLKPNFRPDFKPKDKPNIKRKETKVPKTRIKIDKNTINNKKIFVRQYVQLERLRTHVIRKYDKSFYYKYSKRLKAEKALNKYSKIRQILAKSQSKPNPTANESPKRMLLWSSPTSKVKQQTTYPILRSHVRRLVKCDERENSLMTLPEFCRNLNLISYNDMNRMNTKQMNTTFGIRHIAKSENYFLNQNNEIEINYEYLIGSLDNNQNTNSSQISHKKKKKRSFVAANKVKQKYSKLELQKQRMAELWKKRYLNCMSMYEMSSPMGRRVFNSLKTPKLETRKVHSYVKRYESFCGTRLRFKNNEENELNKWKARRIERLTTGQELSQNRCLKNHQYQYSFTRRQRLEKMLRTETGIDWKSRLLALNCSPKTELMIKKIVSCPICRHTIELSHSCDNSASDCESRSNSSDGFKQNSPQISINNQRVLRHQKSKMDESIAKITPIISPKKNSLSLRRGPRICFIDLDK